MVETLRDITGDLWLINQEAGQGEASILDRRRDAKAKRDRDERAHPAFSHPLLANAKLIEIRDIVPDATPSNIISGDFKPEEDD